MRKAVGAGMLVTAGLALAVAGAAAEKAKSPYDQGYLNGPPPKTPVPAWAFAMDPPASADLKRLPDDDKPRRIAGSNETFTRTEVLDHNDAVDWHPNEHPPAPEIVRHGRRPQPAACAFCHMPNGVGLPENAPLAGLPHAYFIEQVHAFQNGSRRSADMRMASFHGMAEVIAPRITEAELKAAAAYYAGLRYRSYLDVVEAATVPKTRVYQYTLVVAPGGAREPIGNRILEVPEDMRRFDLRDSHERYRVYVPPGSIRRGERLAKTGDGRVQPCVSCHGPGLQGVGDIPPLAARSPSNLVRQLYNFKSGARSGGNAEIMAPIASRLTDTDIVNVVAYISSIHAQR